MKKKMAAILTGMLLAVSLTACGSQDSGSSAPGAVQEEVDAAQADTAEQSGEPDAAQETEGQPERQAEESTEAAADTNQPSAEGGKTLVVYYSATGHTEKVAEYIAAAADADTFALEPVEPYSSDDLDWRDADSRVSREHENEGERNVELVSTTVDNWESYDTVFIGYPIWWHIAAWPVDGFVTANDFTGKTVIPFCTSSSSDLEESGELLAEAAGTGNWLEGMRFASNASEETVRTWVDGLGLQSAAQADAGASAVYFTSDISPDGLMAAYKALNWEPTGKVAVKLSTGEPPASNYLDPQLIKDLVQSVDGTIVECNTAYGGSRTETAMHRQVAEDHGFTAIADVDILDEEGSMELPVEGFGGAIKNISIGLGSKEGKCLIHTAGQSHDNPWVGEQTGFTESMAEAGKSVSDYLGYGDRIIYINVLNNISIDCDCDGNPAEPDIHDIGIVASYDPVAIDQACIDLAFAAEGSQTLQDRVNSRDGLHTLEHAEKIGLGSRSYELINLDV